MKILFFITAMILIFFQYTQAEIIRVSEPRWITTPNMIPNEFSLNPSNSNVSIVFHEDRLYMAWRNAPTHFASTKTKIFVASSDDMGKTWVAENEIALGTDAREPFLISIKGQLILQFIEGGPYAWTFAPKHMLQTIRQGPKNWTTPQPFGRPGEVPWEVKVRNGQVYMTSYIGDHYSFGKSKINIHFSQSSDGLNWKPVNPNLSTVYQGGVSEVGFEFTEDGVLWGVTRNEDGDDTGFGSHVVSSTNWGADPWKFPSVSNKNRYDSPRMFRHKKDIYLVARRDVGGPFWQASAHLPFNIQKWLNLIQYSFRKKRTALYKIDQSTKQVKYILDFPSAGDNAFPSIIQKDTDTFLIANYSSPFSETELNWLEGQLSRKGTNIYIVEINFSHKN
jgi:hypothetical protein